MNTSLPFASLALALIAAQDKPVVDPVRERLDKSPRHHEWIDVKRDERTLHCFAAYPETDGKTAVVIVIHENKGLTDWVRAVADRLAESGYVAVAPDLLSGKGPKGGNTDSFESTDAATQAIYALDQDQVTADLNAVADRALEIPSCNGKLAVAGFCWGGGQSFDFATKRKGLRAAFVFYGSAPKDAKTLEAIDCPVFGFYGESDSRITTSVPATGDAMKKAGKSFDPVVYAGAGHGFMRAGEEPDATPANQKALADAWKRWKELLAKCCR